MHKTLVGLALAAAVLTMAGCSQPAPTVTKCPDSSSLDNLIIDFSDEETMNKGIDAVNEFGQGLVGMAETTAEQCVIEAGLEWRVYQRDGEMFALTMDYRIERINVNIEKGIVQDAYTG